MPDLLSSVIAGVKKDFAEGEAFIEQTWDKAVAAFPPLAAVAAAGKSAAKQALSNAFAFADMNLDPRFSDAVSMAESAGDTVAMAMTHGAVAPAIPALNAMATLVFGQLHAALHLAEADFRAKLQLPPPTADSAPTIAGLETAAASAGAQALGLH